MRSIGSAQDRGVAIAALGGISAALLLLWIPVGLIEMVVASSGISEAWPAAAPPLGLKARLLLAGFAGLMVVGLISVTRRSRKASDGVEGMDGRKQGAQGARQMGFAFSKLTALARGRVAAPFDQPREGRAPSLRRADAHPDAPARAPIFASRDFYGLDIFSKPESGQPLAKPVAPAADAATLAPDPVEQENLLQPSFQRPAASVAEAEAEAEIPMPFECAPDDLVETLASVIAPMPVSEPDPDPTPESTHGLTIAQLTERLERGLSLRARAPMVTAGMASVIADMPVAAPVPVRDSVAPDADDALRAALGALRTMAGRAR